MSDSSARPRHEPSSSSLPPSGPQQRPQRGSAGARAAIGVDGPGELRLMGLAAAIARADLPFDAALRRVVEEAQPFIGADRATIRLLREEGAEVETTFVLGDRTGFGQSGGRVATAADAGWREMAEQWRKLEPPQVLASARALHAPVEIDGAVAGSVSFEHGDDDRPWPPGAMEAARIAGGLVAMAECQRVHRAHEQANRVRQQIHDAIVDVARDFIFVVDRALRVSYVNAYAAAAVGREPSEIVGASLDQVFPPSTSERQQRNLRKVFETGSPLYVETETPFAGTSRWLDTWLLPLRADDGTVHSVVGISRDTTDRKRTEQALRTSEASYRTLIDLSPDSISLTDLEGRFLLVNRRGLEMNGAASLEELVAQHRTAFDVIAPEDRARAVEYAQKTLAEGQVTNLEYRLLRRDGSAFPAELSAAVVPDDQGKPKALIAIVRDVSARRQTEHALAGEKERLLVTLASIAEGVVTTDVDGRVELLNRVAEQLTGWSVDEARGRPLSEVLRLQQGPEAESEPDTLTDAVGVMSGPKRARRSVLVARDGTRKAVAASAAPIRGAQGAPTGVVIVVHDVTEREKLEREVQRVESLESVGILAAGVAHDVNNIMTAILGNVSLAKALASADARVLERLAEAERAIGRAKDLTQQLLGFARGTNPEKRTADIANLVRETARFAARGSSSAVSARIDPALWAVDVDESQITQVVSNLVINALQAQPGGGTVEVLATNVMLPNDATLPVPDGAYVKIAVRDHGVGIRPEDLSRIFDPYFTTKVGGSGLGLTICHVIVRNHGGHLTAESRLGEGTTFLVYLPASQARARASDRPAPGVVPGRGRVLVVDDDRAIREVSELMLEYLGYQVQTASDGEQAVVAYRSAMASSQRFDAVVLDLTMPGGPSGDATMARLLEIDPSAVGIVASGYSEDPVMIEGARYGFRGAVAKPFRIEELSQVLAAAMRGPAA